MNLPSLPVIPSVLTLVFRKEKLPRSNSAQAPQHRVSPLQGVRGCHPARSRGTKALTGADTGDSRVWAVAPEVDGWSSAANSPAKIFCLPGVVCVDRLLDRDGFYKEARRQPAVEHTAESENVRAVSQKR